mgnify:CR=1 FL=1
MPGDAFGELAACKTLALQVQAFSTQTAAALPQSECQFVGWLVKHRVECVYESEETAVNTRFDCVPRTRGFHIGPSSPQHRVNGWRLPSRSRPSGLIGEGVG